MTKHSNGYVHNKDPIAQRKKNRLLKNILIWGSLGSLGVMVGWGLIKSDLERSTELAKSYADEYLEPAKAALKDGHKNRAKEIAGRGYARLGYSLGRHQHDINFNSRYCIAIGDSLYNLSQLK